MIHQNNSAARPVIRCFAIGVLLSMVAFYSIHVYGKWTIENYRPDPETTASVLLHNHCLLLNKLHTLRPNTETPTVDNSINGTKLAGSFMNFTDGHIVGILMLAIVLGLLILLIKKMLSQK